ncbi:MAG: radical SAM protein [Nitrospinae bacterium]|nr:radical SAM protein [Nitrospinota bacterium]
MKKLLLTGVFKPFGVSDEYGEALCTMELLNNQVTREQGIHSPRSNNPSFGLYLMAENLEIPATVLDFPDWEDFTKEIRNGNYTHVGISFIVPNVLKVKRMAEYVRKHAPNAVIILGGHGAGIPGLEEIVDYDEVCRGEGVFWLRRYFGEDVDKPILHPVSPSAVRKYVYGAPIISDAGIIITGVGCQNTCRFCATTHKFEKQYTAFLSTGKEVFDACVKTGAALKVEDFALMDENFCKSPKRARELLVNMESHGKAYTFSTFSSAETIGKLGIDFLVRLGVKFLWIGVESKANVFEKTQGIDLHALIADLQNHGITVLASAILFMEHHDKQTIHEDIDWAISLESDLLQFMQFGPIPGTRLYKDYDAEGKLLKDIPWPKQHGQDEIWFNHPSFTLKETATYTRDAFIKKFQTHGPGVINMAHSYVKGYITVAREVAERQKRGMTWNAETLRYEETGNHAPDEFMKLRLEAMKRSALEFRPVFKAAELYAPNIAAAKKARMVAELYEATFGPPTLTERVQGLAVRGFAFVESIRAKDGDVMRQPGTIRHEWPDRHGAVPQATEENHWVRHREHKRPQTAAAASRE